MAPGTWGWGGFVNFGGKQELAMQYVIRPETKVRIVRIGPVRTFGEYEKRQDMAESALVELFDGVWANGLESAVGRSLPCEYDAARSRLKGKQLDFLREHEEQRQFPFQRMDFIVQLKETATDDCKEVTQLWKTQSGDDHPKTIWVTFDSVEERQKFRDCANELGWHDETLALALLRDFMDKLKNIAPTS